MFKIATQSVQLRSAADLETMRKGDEPDGAPITLNFLMYDADTSKCVLEVVDPDGDTHRVTFNAGGLMISQSITPHRDPEEDPADTIHLDPSHTTLGTNYGRNPSNALPVTERTRMRPNEGSPQQDPFQRPLTPEQVEDRSRTMRDPRADDPNTHVAPIPADVAERGDLNPGFRQPQDASTKDLPVDRTLPPGTVTAASLSGKPNVPPASSPLPGSPALKPADKEQDTRPAFAEDPTADKPAKEK